MVMDAKFSAYIFPSFFRTISRKLVARILTEILRRKKAGFRRNTLCISKNNEFPVEKTG